MKDELNHSQVRGILSRWIKRIIASQNPTYEELNQKICEIRHLIDIENEGQRIYIKANLSQEERITKAYQDKYKREMEDMIGRLNKYVEDFNSYNSLRSIRYIRQPLSYDYSITMLDTFLPQCKYKIMCFFQQMTKNFYYINVDDLEKPDPKWSSFVVSGINKVPID